MSDRDISEIRTHSYFIAEENATSMGEAAIMAMITKVVREAVREALGDYQAADLGWV